MIEALSIIKKRFKEVKLYIAGGNIIEKNNRFIQMIKTPSYPRYIKSLIEKYDLYGNVVFTGNLNEEEMRDKFLNSHVFVSPSTIENSPNSVGEAMLLGVPCVSSDVGGVLDLLKHKSEGFVYQSTAAYMLAHYVLTLFEDNKLCIEFSKKSKEHAALTHNKEINSKTLTDIYVDIAKEN